jgi:hypothetical protein
MARLVRAMTNRENAILHSTATQPLILIRMGLVPAMTVGADTPGREGRAALPRDQASRAATPGRVLPSSHSRNAPPAEDT